MIRSLPSDTLFQVYQDSIKFSLDEEFIDLLESELKRRGVRPDRTNLSASPSSNTHDTAF